MILIIVLFLLLFIVVMPFVYASDMFNGIKTLQTYEVTPKGE